MYPTGVELHNNRIRINFHFRGVRCREVLSGWVVTNANIKKAGNLRARIVSDIQMGTFDFRKFFPESKTAKKFDTTQRIIIFGDLAKTWLENREIDLSPNAVRSYRSAVKMLTKLISDNTLITSITNNDILRWRKELLLGETSYQPGQRANKTGRAVRTVDYYLGYCVRF